MTDRKSNREILDEFCSSRTAEEAMSKRSEIYKRFADLLDRVDIAQAAIKEAHTTMNHAEVFIASREKMHPDGQALYRELLHKLEDLSDE